jgi:hypothetical protein
VAARVVNRRDMPPSASPDVFAPPSRILRLVAKSEASGGAGRIRRMPAFAGPGVARELAKYLRPTGDRWLAVSKIL